jgi:hypothetical protein
MLVLTLFEVWLSDSFRIVCFTLNSTPTDPENAVHLPISKEYTTDTLPNGSEAEEFGVRLGNWPVRRRACFGENKEVSL